MLQFGNLGTRRRRLAHGQVILITRPGDPPSSRPTETGPNTTGQTQGDANGGDRLLETWMLLSKRYKNNQHWKVYSLKNLQTCKSVSQLTMQWPRCKINSMRAVLRATLERQTKHTAGYELMKEPTSYYLKPQRG